MKVTTDPRTDKEIRRLPEKDAARAVRIVEMFEEAGFNLPERYLKKLKHGLWELRSGRVRLLFGLVGGEIIIVDMFIKRTRKTPSRGINKAFQRLKEYEK